MSEYIGCYISNKTGLRQLRLDTSKIRSKFYKTIPRKTRNRACTCYSDKKSKTKIKLEPLGQN
jgi:hypothetical protein